MCYKKRKDCYFGLHFDFHANKETEMIGCDWDDALLREVLETVKPDFVQCDTKGHPGISSYPTKVGVAAPNIAVDILRKWREITAEYNIPLYAHHSGLWDIIATEQNPEWAVVSADGSLRTETSVFSDYAKERLIPQLIEMAQDYQLNGAWVDGECWAVFEDYSDRAKALYKEKYGVEPELPTEEGFVRFQNFVRQGFLDYVHNYISAVKKVAPEFEITSNWLNSSQGVVYDELTDFLSGDFPPTNATEMARYESRFLAAYGREWDLMAWSFLSMYNNFKGVDTKITKSARYLKQEAAQAISQGGSFQVYAAQSPATGVLYKKELIPVLKELADFCRAREDYCHRAKAVPDVAVVFSDAALRYKKNRIFHSFESVYIGATRSALNALIDNGMSAEILLGGYLANYEPAYGKKAYDPTISSVGCLPITGGAQKGRDLSEYSALVVPDAYDIEPELKQILLTYAKNGGHLILMGKGTARLFATDLQLTLQDVEYDLFDVIVGENANDVNVPFIKLQGVGRDLFGLCGYQKKCGRYVQGNNVTSGARVMEYGNGFVYVMPFDFGQAYDQCRTFTLRNAMAKVLNEIPAKLRVKGSNYVDVALMEKDEKTYIHLINMSGEHRGSWDSYLSIIKANDEIPPLSNIQVECVMNQKPKALVSKPSQKEIPFEYDGKTLRFSLDKLDLYEIIAIEN